MRDFLLPQGRPLWISGLRFYPGRVEWHGERVPLTYGEFLVVEALASRPGKRVPSVDLAAIYRNDGNQRGEMATKDNTISMSARKAACQIRAKFRAIDPEFREILTIYPYGYAWKNRALSAAQMIEEAA